MSWEAEAFARRQRTGNPVLKAVLVSIANWIDPRNDWATISIRRLADEVEISERSVQRHIQTLVADGFLEREERTRDSGASGWNAYRFANFHPVRVSHLRPARADGGAETEREQQGDRLAPSPVSDCHRGGDTAVTPERLDKPKPPLPSGDAPKGAAPAAASTGKKVKGTTLPDGWQPPALASLPPTIRKIVESWPSGALALEAEAFVAYFGELAALGSPRARHVDWDRVWANWLRKAAGDVARNSRMGVAYPAAAGAPSAVAADGCERAAAIKLGLASTVGKASWGAWVAACRFEVVGKRLVVRGTGVRIDHIKKQWQALLTRAARAAELDLHFVVEKTNG